MRRPILCLAILAATVAATAYPVGAAPSTGSGTGSNAQRRQELAGQIDLLKASDLDLDREVNRLQNEVSANQAKADDARRQLADLEAELGPLQDDLDQASHDLDVQRRRAAQRAVFAYMHPGDQATDGLLQANDYAEAHHQRTLLEQVAHYDRQVQDGRKRAEAAMEARRVRLLDAQGKADELRRQAESASTDAAGARDQHRQTKQALEGRINEYQSEADALAAQDAAVVAIITQHQSSPGNAKGGTGASTAPASDGRPSTELADGPDNPAVVGGPAPGATPQSGSAATGGAAATGGTGGGSTTAANAGAGSGTGGTKQALAAPAAPTTAAPTTAAPKPTVAPAIPKAVAPKAQTPTTTARATTTTRPAAVTARVPTTTARAPVTTARPTTTTARPTTTTARTSRPPSGGLSVSWPVGGPITSPFGVRWGRMHAGIDIGAPSGTPIRAAAGGKVIYCGWMDGYGNFTLVDHGNGLVTAYGHQSRLGCSMGQSVSAGQVIGYVGSTGNSTGPHLHFETRLRGVPVDPMTYLR